MRHRKTRLAARASAVGLVIAAAPVLFAASTAASVSSSAVLPKVAAPIQGIALATLASTQSPNWGAPQSIDPTGGYLTSISCASTSFCAAVDAGGQALTYDGITWSQPTSIDPSGGGLLSLSCTSASFCVAVDFNGDAVLYNGTAWSQPTSIDPSGSGLTSISCPSASFCVAVDDSNNAISYNGTAWSQPISIDPSGSGLTSISCPSATFCAAVEAAGDALTYNGTTWSTPTPVDSSGGGPTSISCASATFCAAVDANGHVLTYRGTTWSTPGPIDPGQGLTSVSCPSPSFCGTIDVAGHAFLYNGTAWSASGLVDPNGGLAWLSCPASILCAAVDGKGDAVTYVPSVPTVTQVNPTAAPASGGTSVTITGTGFTNATAVSFGSTPATAYTVNSDTSITAISPAEVAGTVDVTVSVPGRISATSSADQFTYQNVPTITAINPNSGPTSGSTSVTITGTDFLNALAVDFGSTGAGSYTVNSSTQITATSPAESAGMVDITVTTPGGTSATSPADRFTFGSAPSITSSNSTTFTTGKAGTFEVKTSGGPPTPSISESGTLPSGVSLTDNHNGTATLSGTPDGGAGGSYAITITASNGVSPDAQQNFTLVVNQPASLPSGVTHTWKTGVNDTFSVDATGYPTPTITHSGSLPNGLTLATAPGAVTISGTPAADSGGTYSMKLVASNSAGTSTQTVTVNVLQPAVMAQPANGATVGVKAGTPFSIGWSVYASATTWPHITKPVTFTTSGFPAGLTFNDNGNGTGTITGTLATGTYNNLGITAVNSAGSSMTTFSIKSQ